MYVNVRNGASVIIDTTSSSGVLVQNSWLTVVVTYRASTREYWLSVNGVGVSAGIAPAVGQKERCPYLGWAEVIGVVIPHWVMMPSSTVKWPVFSC